jgi:ankyrin repeat protein
MPLQIKSGNGCAIALLLVCGYVILSCVYTSFRSDEERYKHTSLIGAIIDGDVRAFRYFSAKEAGSSWKDASGSTLLHIAVREWGGNKDLERAEIVKLLLDRGVDVNAKNTRGETPLHEARLSGVGASPMGSAAV